MVVYLTGASLVFSILLHAFIKDSDTPKTDALSWVVLAVATVFWPLVLPSMLRKQLRKSIVLDPRYLH